tara:strand:+ start:81 stop:554 length:474 start_codon:yes stop_codon:yes gene_type:complete
MNIDKNHLLEINTNIKLKPVTKDDALFLYELLKNRDPGANISHKKMPSYEEHIEFIKSKPYTSWYIIEYQKEDIGAIYLSRRDEIGITSRMHSPLALEKYTDSEFFLITTAALKLFMKLNPRKRYLANASPKNKKLGEFFVKNGFTALQNVYEISSD